MVCTDPRTNGQLSFGHALVQEAYFQAATSKSVSGTAGDLGKGELISQTVLVGTQSRMLETDSIGHQHILNGKQQGQDDELRLSVSIEREIESMGVTLYQISVES